MRRTAESSRHPLASLRGIPFYPFEASPSIPPNHNTVTAIRGNPAILVSGGLAVLQLPGRLDDCQALLACVWATHCVCMLAESRAVLWKR